MKLHVTRAGAGEPVILLHSGGMSGRQWRKLAEALAPTHQAIMPDLFGSGDSPPWPEDTPFHFMDDAREILASIEAEGGAAHLVGHSYGGLLALTIARAHPERVRSLAVYDPVAFGVVRAADDPEGMEDLRRAEAVPVFLDDAAGGTDVWFEAFVNYWNGPGAWRALPPASRDAFLRVGKKVYLEVRSLMADQSPASTYASITARTLLLFGERSPPAARRVVALLAQAIPGARLHGVAGAGHMGPLTHAAEVNTAIVDHVRGARGA